MRNLDILRVESVPAAGLFQDPLVEPANEVDRDAPVIEFVPANYFAPLDLATVFSRLAPLEVDLGCGDGAFLVAMAEKFPERNFLGIERLSGRVRSACNRAERHVLANLRILRLETLYAVEYLLPPGSAVRAHLLFPDPWPKKKHQRRRIVTQEFLAAMHRLLAPGGCIHIATDQADYFAAMRELVARSAFVDDPATRREAFPLTTFEKRFLAVGAPIHRLLLRKTL